MALTLHPTINTRPADGLGSRPVKMGWLGVLREHLLKVLMPTFVSNFIVYEAPVKDLD